MVSNNNSTRAPLGAQVVVAGEMARAPQRACTNSMCISTYIARCKSTSRCLSTRRGAWADQAGVHILTEVHILTLKNWPPPNFELALEWTDVQKSQKWRRGSFFVFFFWAGGGGTSNFFAFERGNWVWGLVSNGTGDWYDRDSSKLSSLWSLLNNTAIILITHDLPANEEQEEYMVQALWICGPDIALLHYLTFIPGVLLWVHQHHPPPPPAPCHHDCGGDHMWGIPGFYFWGPRRGGATSRRQLYRIISAPSPLFILASVILSSWSSFKTLFWPTVYRHTSTISFRTRQKKYYTQTEGGRESPCKILSTWFFTLMWGHNVYYT